MSLEYKINAIRATWTKTLTEIANRKDIGNVLDVLVKISEALGDIVSKAGLLKTAFVSIATIWGSKKLG